jgi:hypothetical protein
MSHLIHIDAIYVGCPVILLKMYQLKGAINVILICAPFVLSIEGFYRILPTFD